MKYAPSPSKANFYLGKMLRPELRLPGEGLPIAGMQFLGGAAVLGALLSSVPTEVQEGGIFLQIPDAKIGVEFQEPKPPKLVVLKDGESADPLSYALKQLRGGHISALALTNYISNMSNRFTRRQQ